VACENDVINLVCHPGQRVAIFSASFGRTEYESMQCPQPRGVQEESKYRLLLINGGLAFLDLLLITLANSPPFSSTAIKVTFTLLVRA